MTKKTISVECRLKIKRFFKEQLWVHLIVFGSIFACSWLFGKYIEGILFCICHTSIRVTFDKQFHFNKTALCLLLTLSIIWFSIPITLPLHISLLSCIPVSFLISFFGYLAQDRVDLLVYKRNNENFNLENCTEEQLVRVCKLLHYKQDKIDIAIMFFVDKMSNKQVWEVLCKTNRNVEWDTVKKYRYRMLKDFNKFIKD